MISNGKVNTNKLREEESYIIAFNILSENLSNEINSRILWVLRVYTRIFILVLITWRVNNFSTINKFLKANIILFYY